MNFLTTNVGYGGLVDNGWSLTLSWGFTFGLLAMAFCWIAFTYLRRKFRHQ